MKTSRTQRRDFEAVADETGTSPEDVKNIVNSFFDVIASESRKLPFDNPRKIFSKSAFDKYVNVLNIPFIGRIGPSYTRYLRWRANEAEKIRMIPKPKGKHKMLPEEIEAVARIVLDGGGFEPKRNKDYSFNRVWLVGLDGKKSARQVIPKEKNNV